MLSYMLQECFKDLIIGYIFKNKDMTLFATYFYF